MSTLCTCNHKTPCTMAFVYEDGQSIAEIPLEHVTQLKPIYTWRCAGEALKAFNTALKNQS